MTAPNAGWSRLDPRTAIAYLKYVVGPLIPVGVATLVLGAELVAQAGATLALVIGLSVAFYADRLVRVATTRFRIGDELLEVRAGLLSHTYRAIPRDRVRNVDLTATPLHRALGLTVVKIGTGQSFAGTELKPLVLDAIGRERAAQLRTALLAGDVGVPEQGVELARLDRRWLRYAPLSVTGLAAVWLLIAAAYKLVETVGLDVLDTRPATWVLTRLAALDVVSAVALVACGVLAVGSIGSLLLFTEAWWGYRLTREPDGSLRVRRGLLTRRSVSLDRAHLRGVELTELLSLRPVRAGGLRAVATGVSRGHGAALVGSAVLLPPAPLGVASAVAAAALDAAEPPVGPDVALRPHPRAALRRRMALAGALIGALVAGAAAASAAGVAPQVVWAVPAVAGPLAVLLAVDSYRSLGHSPGGRHLVVRSGTMVRTTVALEHAGVIGWRISRSPTQRLAGLCTLIATSAAGRGYFPVRDITDAQALALALATVPAPLQPFLEPVEVGPHAATACDRTPQGA